MKAVVDTLNIVTEKLKERFPDCEVFRTYLPNVAISKLKPGKPKIMVVLYDNDLEKLARGISRHRITIDIAVLQKVEGHTNVETVDPLIDIVDATFNFLFANRFSDGNFVYRIETANHGEAREICFEEWLNDSLFFGAMQIEVVVDKEGNP